MKRPLKIYGLAWALLIPVTIVTLAGMMIRNSHHDLAADPNMIEKIVKVDLPDIASCESEDNLDRGASRWDRYIHHGQFTEEVSDNTIQTMDNLCKSDSLHWSKNIRDGSYCYSEEGGIDNLYFVSCVISKDHFVTTYQVDETEGVFVFIPFMFAYMILLIWGMILIVVNLVRRKLNKS